MFQQETDEKLRELPNVFGIADNNLVADYDVDGEDHDRMLHIVLQICRKENVKLNEDKCHFWCTPVPFFGQTTWNKYKGTYWHAN